MSRPPVTWTLGERALDCLVWLVVGTVVAQMLRCTTGCGGDPFVLAAAVDGGSVVVLEGGLPTVDSRAADAYVGERAPIFVDAPADAPARDEAANDAPRNEAMSEDAHTSDASTDAGALDAQDGAVACDPAYGDASPGGPCCVHVWADSAHTLGAVLCTLDGVRWCEQSGAPCSPPGSRCIVQAGVSYCAP